MLLDQKRTRRTVQVVAVLTSIAFAGVIFVVLGLILFGGGESAAEQQLADARARVEEQPRNPDAWQELASAYAGAEQLEEAVSAAERAVELAPRDSDPVQSLVALELQRNNHAGAIDALQGYVAANPRDADAFLQLAQLADDADRVPLARLSYQTFLRLAPDDPNADQIRERLGQLSAPARAAP